MTVDGLPRIVRVATAYLVPFVDRFLPRAEGRALIDIVATAGDLVLPRAV